MQLDSKCKCIDLDLLSPNEFYGHFVLTKLESSEGTTIGNMLRRTLLSNLYGFRIVGVRIAGINNEFAVLEGVREDLVEIILNLKEIIIKNNDKTGQSCYGRLRVQGPCVVTAGSLELPYNVKVLNPGNHLLTISDKSLIELEVKIESGKSYVLAKDQRLEGAIDFIPIDSNFAPVSKVNWYLKTLPEYVQSKTEELHLEIFTNGTLLPHQALLQARIMVGYMLSSINSMEFPCFDTSNISDTNDKRVIRDKFESAKLEQGEKINSTSKDLNENIVKNSIIEVQPKSIDTNSRITSLEVNLTSKEDQICQTILANKDQGTINLKNEPLKSLGFSTRVVNALKKANINSTLELKRYPFSDLIDIEGLGPKSVQEIENKLNLFYSSFNE